MVTLLLLNIGISNLLICAHSLILMDTNSDSNFIGGFAGSLRDWRTGLDPDSDPDPDPRGATCLYICGCTPQLEFDAATSIATNEKIPISKGLQAACRGKES